MKQNLLDFMDLINHGIVILDQDQHITYINQFMLRILETERENVLGRDIFRVMPNLESRYLRASLPEVLAHEQNLFLCAAMHRGLFQNGRMLNLSVAACETQMGKNLLLEFMDVTDSFVRIRRLRGGISQLLLQNRKLREKEETISNLAYYDILTGVANRALFYELSEKLLEGARRRGELLALLFIDMDHFKRINDTYGHDAGDAALIRVAEILTDATRKNDVVARFGGDEFLVLLTQVDGPENCRKVISRIHAPDNRQISYNGQSIPISLSIGVSFFPKDAKDMQGLLSEADQAMYRVKRRVHEQCQK